MFNFKYDINHKVTFLLPKHFYQKLKNNVINTNSLFYINLTSNLLCFEIQIYL